MKKIHQSNPRARGKRGGGRRRKRAALLGAVASLGESPPPFARERSIATVA
jgi:hypothetical protein